MGVCKAGFTPIHAVLKRAHAGDTLQHTSANGIEIWTLGFGLFPAHGGQVDEFEVGRIRNVRKSIRLTREMFALDSIWN